MANARWGAREDDCSSFQSGARGEKCYEGRDIENELIKLGLLNQLIIEEATDRELFGTRQGIGSNDARPDRTKGVERLCAAKLAAAPLVLPVTRADVVGKGVAEDEVQGFSTGDIAATLADNDSQLGLKIHFLGLGMASREAYGFLMGLKGVRQLDKESGVLRRGTPHFGRVCFVV